MKKSKQNAADVKHGEHDPNAGRIVLSWAWTVLNLAREARRSAAVAARRRPAAMLVPNSILQTADRRVVSSSPPTPPPSPSPTRHPTAGHRTPLRRPPRTATRHDSFTLVTVFFSRPPDRQPVSYWFRNWPCT